MAKDSNNHPKECFEYFLQSELAHIRRLGANSDVAFACRNLGAYEALLVIMQSGEGGLPVYQAIESVQTPFSGAAGVINRLKAMRELGLLQERSGQKKSQVCLVPSQKLLGHFYSVLAARHDGAWEE